MNTNRPHGRAVLAAGLALALGLVLSLVGSAIGSCRWTFDCSTGPCRQVQVCDSTIDPPAIRPPQVPPIAPPSLRPIPTPVVPPIGTSQCEPVYLCSSAGQCRWQTVCR